MVMCAETVKTDMAALGQIQMYREITVEDIDDNGDDDSDDEDQTNRAAF